MAWDIDVKEKIYQRLANEIFFRIFHGQYQLGAKLPSYQVIAKEAGSSPETVRKAFCELQAHGLIIKTRWGNYVTSEKEKVLTYREQYLEDLKKQYSMEMQKVSFD